MAEARNGRYSISVYVLELFTLMPVGFLWIAFVHLLGGVFPMGSITWFVIVFAWSISPVAVQYRDWLWGKLYGDRSAAPDRDSNHVDR